MKIEQYQTAYPAAPVTDISEYTEQTLGNIIEQIRTFVIGSIVIALFMMVLITALFLNMLLSKDRPQIYYAEHRINDERFETAIYGWNAVGTRYWHHRRVGFSTYTG